MTKNGFCITSPGYTDRFDAGLLRGREPPGQADWISHAPGGSGHLREAAETAVGIAGIGDRYLQETGTSPNGQLDQFPEGHGQLEPRLLASSLPWRRRNRKVRNSCPVWRKRRRSTGSLTMLQVMRARAWGRK